MTHMCLAAAHAENGNEKEADRSVAQLIAQCSDFEKEVKSNIKRVFCLDEIVDALMDGLRKAGLDI